MIRMGMDEGKTWLSYAEAAKRVQSSGRTVRNWRRNGMVMGWAVDETGQRYRVVEESVLLAWWRKTMQASPVHFYKLRQKAIERGEEAPEIPERFRYSRNRDSSLRNSENTGTPIDMKGVQTPHTPERKIDPLADMPTLRGGPEYYALTEKLKDATPSCAGIAEYTADRVDEETLAMMAGICAHCPLLARCEAFATASRPAAGFWAGQSWREFRDEKRDPPHAVA